MRGGVLHASGERGEGKKKILCVSGERERGRERERERGREREREGERERGGWS